MMKKSPPIVQLALLLCECDLCAQQRLVVGLRLTRRNTMLSDPVCSVHVLAYMLMRNDRTKH